ncbi:MAG: undecaprenyl/decaprenyl-phosphate alpha-N-acetylglucosaminyl 1-phosphate transferase [Coriobacteriia bacterium]|nr:undecaprenyl/decaprenyl-phosphate alpha-N-acetylglucosaminyl 1-phosphate transferase [Coriobacteriia bacterium]
MITAQYLLIGLVAFAGTFFVTPVVRAMCLRRGFVAEPGARKIHTKPVPEMGGMAILFGIALATGLHFAAESFFGWTGFHADAAITPLMLVGVAFGTFIVYTTGLIDDILDISAGFKLAGQIVAGLVVAFSGVKLSGIANPFGEGLISFGWFTIPLTVLYFVAFANIINLVDGMDGLAAGISGIAAVSLAIIAAQQAEWSAAIIAIAVAGSCLAFLRYNFYPASIFMGDQGALMLGFLLGAISLLGVLKTPATLSFALPFIILAVPILDTFSAIVRRLRAHLPIKQRDTGHVHHRLMRRGYGQRRTALIVYAWSILLGVGGFLIAEAEPFLRLVVVIMLFVITAILTWWLNLFGVVYHHPDSDVS